MHASLEAFMKNNSPESKASCMEKYIEQIFHLKQNGYSYPQIRDWLKLNGITVTHQAIRQFVFRRIKENSTSATSLELSK